MLPHQVSAPCVPCIRPLAYAPAMCVGVVKTSSIGVEVALFGVTHSVANNVRWSRDHAAVCLGSVDFELLDLAFSRLAEDVHPEEVELELTFRDEHAPSRQWLLASKSHGCHGWSGTRCSGYRGVRRTLNNDRAAMTNWAARPDPLADLVGTEADLRLRLSDAVEAGLLLIPARSAASFRDGQQVRVDFAASTTACAGALRSGTGHGEVPEQVREAWSAIVAGYRDVFLERDRGRTRSGLDAFARARELDPQEVQGWLWPMYAHEALDQQGEADGLVAGLLPLLAADPTDARKRLGTILRLADTAPVGLGHSARYFGAILAARHGL